MYVGMRGIRLRGGLCWYGIYTTGGMCTNWLAGMDSCCCMGSMGAPRLRLGIIGAKPDKEGSY